MKERYKIIKKIYPNYLILIKDKNKIKTFNVDNDIINTFGIDNIKNVNTLILDNLNIEKIDSYKNNKYELYYVKIKIIKEIINETKNYFN